MISTAQDIITDALQIIGVIAANETPATEDLNLGLRTLNGMLGRWSASSLLIRSTTEDSYVVPAGTTSFTIGSGGNCNTGKPIKILNAYMRDSGGTDTEVRIIEYEEYDSYVNKDVAATPDALYYDPGASQGGTLGTAYLYPKADQQYTIYFRSDKYFTEFTSLSTTSTFEDMYYEALAYGLAVRLFRKFKHVSVPIPQDIVDIAASAKKDIGVVNAVSHKSIIDIGRKGNRYNIYTDGS